MDPNALSGKPRIQERINVKAFVLPATRAVFEVLSRLPETRPWVDSIEKANCYIVVAEVTMADKISAEFVLKQGVSNDLTGESAKEAIEVGKNEIGKVRRLLTETTMDLLEKMSRVARKEYYETEENFKRKVQGRTTGNSEKTGIGCDKPWPKKIFEEGKCVENRKQGYKSLTTQLASQDCENQFCHFFIQENKETDKAYKKRKRI
jgi:hypothetical protein